MSAKGKYLISLVVPVYGVEKYIEKFAFSALSQDFDALQFVFVNDGTTDRSMEVLGRVIDEHFAERKDDVVIVNKSNEGLPLARRTGVENSDGEYILFADSDDWLEEGAVRKVAERIRETHADIVYFDLVKEYGGRSSYKREKDYLDGDSRKFIINMFNYRSHGYTVTKCFRRELYTEHTVYTPPYGMHEDIYLMSQIVFYARTFSHIGEALYHYRKDNEASFCSQSPGTRHINSTKNMLDLYGHYREHLQGSPIQDVWGGILMRAGWHSISHGYDFYGEYPYLAGDILKAPLSFNYRIGIIGQLAVKLYSLFKR